MNNQEAAEWARKIDATGGLDSYVCYEPEYNTRTAILDGSFTVQQLEEIILMMRLAQEKKK